MATLTLGIKENATIGGTKHSFDTTDASADYEITGVNHVFQHTLDVLHTGDMQLVKFHASVESAGQIKQSNFKYMRVTNNDTTNFVVLALQDATNNYSKNFKLLAGQSLMFTSLSFDTTDSGVTLGTHAQPSRLAGTAEEVIARANTATCSLDIFVAYA